MIETVKKEVYQLLNQEKSGHGIDHIDRVLKLSLQFSHLENVNQELVVLIALLHDVDDYKIFGHENANNLTHTRAIMEKAQVPMDYQEIILSTLKNFGYSHLLKGLRPQTLEGQIVSDADMCDAIGAHGIIRAYTYSLKHQKPFFDQHFYPLEDLTYEEYTHRCSDSTINHMFEKLLKLKDFMLTSAGKKEAEKRHQIMVDFLYQYFMEENNQDWIDYFNRYKRGELTNES